ncbi:exodeoxyribonuclease VII small subunit [Deinococcus sp. Arct2-2]|uniref:exodeoxyribonuclease VII small subunit n=1 Tax=Deinococcus sp. Arct2-2 TaxID=2568653 RepID=UPI0010A3802E|nr:exodeoxyribonuclease VII small subunit [Deinococcus sp. Arct2-2]THF69102.1 exodeoxyribonuclease VII small subunit [Deinococcus sp. Arct2-2]
MPDVSSPLGYRDAYAKLSRIAAELESGEADLDRVLPLLEEAKAAYAACHERIEAVRAVLAGSWGAEVAGVDADSSEQEDPDDATDEPY